MTKPPKSEFLTGCLAESKKNFHFIGKLNYNIDSL
jgi:hypothetical protein